MIGKPLIGKSFYAMSNKEYPKIDEESTQAYGLCQCTQCSDCINREMAESSEPQDDLASEWEKDIMDRGIHDEENVIDGNLVYKYWASDWYNEWTLALRAAIVENPNTLYATSLPVNEDRYEIVCSFDGMTPEERKDWEEMLKDLNKRFDERQTPTAPAKSCSCGSKFSSRPMYHQNYCDLYKKE